MTGVARALIGFSYYPQCIERDMSRLELLAGQRGYHVVPAVSFELVSGRRSEYKVFPY